MAAASRRAAGTIPLLRLRVWAYRLYLLLWVLLTLTLLAAGLPLALLAWVGVAGQLAVTRPEIRKAIVHGTTSLSENPVDVTLILQDDAPV